MSAKKRNDKSEFLVYCYFLRVVFCTQKIQQNDCAISVCEPVMQPTNQITALYEWTNQLAALCKMAGSLI